MEHIEKDKEREGEREKIECFAIISIFISYQIFAYGLDPDRVWEWLSQWLWMQLLSLQFSFSHAEILLI